MKAAEERYKVILPQRGTFLFGGPGLSIDHLLGLLAQTTGEPDKAAGHFEDAIGLCRRAGYKPEMAWCLYECADVLRERDAPGDRQKATALLSESLAISSELGMKPLMERVLARKTILKA